MRLGMAVAVLGVAVMKILQSLALVAATGGLSACSSDDDFNLSDPPTFDDLAVEEANLIGEYAGEDFTPVDDMPTSGSATYNGVAAYSSSEVSPDAIRADPDSLSSITMTADFSSSDIFGRAHDFQSARGIDIDGGLEITGGTITGNDFDANMGGTLTEDGVEVSYDGGVVGDFVGEGAEALEGSSAAVATPEDGDPYVVRGVFIAD